MASDRTTVTICWCVNELTDDSERAAHIRKCEVCGAEAGSVEQSMKNAVMRGRLGDD